METTRADDLDAIADWFVRVIAPAAIRSWADNSPGRHRQRWNVRAEALAGLPPVSSWPVHQVHRTRRAPVELAEISNRVAGCQGLHWPINAISMLAHDSRAWGYNEKPFQGIVHHFRTAGHALSLLSDDARLVQVWAATRSTLHELDPARTFWSEGWETERSLTPERDAAAPLTTPAPSELWSSAVRAAIE